MRKYKVIGLYILGTSILIAGADYVLGFGSDHWSISYIAHQMITMFVGAGLWELIRTREP